MSRSALPALTTLLAAALAITPAAAVAQTTPAPLSIATDQGGDVYRFRVGEIRVTALSDGTVPQDLHQLLQRTTPARIDALLERNFQSNPVEASINAYLVASGPKGGALPGFRSPTSTATESLDRQGPLHGQ